MIVEEIFNDEIYPNLKQYLADNSIYSPTLTKRYPQESKVFPIVPVILYQSSNDYENLSYGEERYDFRIDIDVYAIDKTIDNVKVSKREIANEITKLIEEYFKTNYRVSLTISLDFDNVDSDVHRNNIKINGTLDTKYGENHYVIYP